MNKQMNRQLSLIFHPTEESHEALFVCFKMLDGVHFRLRPLVCALQFTLSLPHQKIFKKS